MYLPHQATFVSSHSYIAKILFWMSIGVYVPNRCSTRLHGNRIHISLLWAQSFKKYFGEKGYAIRSEN